jgi:sortase A
MKIINPTDVDKILIQEGRDLLTLLTCHPCYEVTEIKR